MAIAIEPVAGVVDALSRKTEALLEIREIIEAVENRCMAADGPVTPTHQEITDEEIRRIYKLAGGKIRK